MSEWFASGLVPIQSDTKRVLLAKILLALNGGGGGGGVGAQEVFFNAGPPGALTPTATNAVYGNTDTGELHWWYGGAWH